MSAFGARFFRQPRKSDEARVRLPLPSSSHAPQPSAFQSPKPLTTFPTAARPKTANIDIAHIKEEPVSSNDDTNPFQWNIHRQPAPTSPFAQRRTQQTAAAQHPYAYDSDHGSAHIPTISRLQRHILPSGALRQIGLDDCFRPRL
jgi:hypothetical protein